jgi:hypothetical protein
MDHEPWHKTQERQRQDAKRGLEFNNTLDWGLAKERLQEYIF